MRGMVLVGIVLIVLGILGLVLGGVSYTKDKETADLGPIDVSVEEKEKVAIPKVLSIGALVAGVILLGVGATRRGGA